MITTKNNFQIYLNMKVIRTFGCLCFLVISSYGYAQVDPLEDFWKNAEKTT